MKNTTKIESHTSGRTIGMNLMSAVVGAAMSMMASTATASPAMSNMLGSAASVSNTTVNQSMRQVVHEPTTVVADRFILRADSAHLTDTQIRARLVDAIMRKDLVIQSIADEFFSESNGGGFSAGLGFLGLVQGVRNVTDLAASMGGIGAHVVDVEEIDRRVNNFASLVGEEQFNLVVGGTLLAQSAFYGQKEHGEKVSAPRNEVPAASTASEHIEAGRIQHEIVPEEHSFEDESFNIPLGDLISLVSTLTPKEELAKAVADDMKAQGKSNKEAMEAAQEVVTESKEFFEDSKTKEIRQKLKVSSQKQTAAKAKMQQLEREHPELRVASATSVTHSDDSGSSEGMREPSLEQRLSEVLEWANARRDFEAQKSEVMEQMALLNEHIDAYTVAHPKIAKYSRILVDVVGTAAIAATAFSGVGAVAETLAAGEAFNYLIQNGSDKFVEYCALQGRTEAEAVRYGTAAAGIVEKMMLITAIRGGIKMVGSRGTSRAGKAMSTAEAATKARQTFQLKAVNENVVTARIMGEMQQSVLAALPAPLIHKHHIFPQKFKPFFAEKGINIDDHCIELGLITHERGVHGNGNMGMMPGKWNIRWNKFIRENPDATRKEIYQFAGNLLDEYGLGHMPIVTYKK